MRPIPTSAQTVAFWKYMCRKYGTTVKSKDAIEMQIIGAVLASMGIMDKEKFARNFTITLGHGIYPNFKIGDNSEDAVSLTNQVVACVHEHVHVRQFHDADFVWDYCLDSSKRTLKECVAYRASNEVLWYLCNLTWSPVAICRTLKSYNVTSDDLAFALDWMTKARAITVKGGIIEPESKVAIKWLKSHGI